MKKPITKQPSSEQNKKPNKFAKLLCESEAAMKSAWCVIIHNKHQAFLTLLGFFAAAFLVTAILFGAHSAMIANGYKNSPLGADILTMRLNDGTWLSGDDLCSGFEGSYEVSDVIPMQRIENVEMYGNSKKVFSFPVIATNSVFFDYAAVKMVKGKPFSVHDVNSRTFTAVISEEAAKELFGDSDPLGQDIKLNNQVYSVSCVFTGKSKFNPGCLVIIPNKSARIILGAADVDTYVFTGVDDEKAAKSEVCGFVDKMITEKKKTSSKSGEFGYSVEYNGVQKNSAYTIGIIMYIIMLLISGLGLLMFLFFPSSGKDCVSGEPQSRRKLRPFAICELVCVIISLIGCALGVAAGIPAGILYCLAASISPIFDLSILRLLLTVLGISMLFGILAGTIPGFILIKNRKRDAQTQNIN